MRELNDKLICDGLVAHLRSTLSRPPLNFLFDPYFLAHRALFEAIGRLSMRLPGGTILDVGCGSKPYHRLFSQSCYIGIDIINSGHDHTKEQIDVYYDGAEFPFSDESFDLVLSFQVLEHVFTPDLFLTEIQRVLKPDGVLLLTVPLLWNEHEQPQDFARYTSFGIGHLLRESNLVMLHHEKLNPGFAALCQLICAHVALQWRRTPMLLFLPPLITMCNSSGLVSSLCANQDESLYLDNLVVARKGG